MHDLARLSRKNGDISLSALPKDRTKNLPGLLHKIPSLRASSMEADKTVFTIFCCDLARELNSCPANIKGTFQSLHYHTNQEIFTKL